MKGTRRLPAATVVGQQSNEPTHEEGANAIRICSLQRDTPWLDRTAHRESPAEAIPYRIRLRRTRMTNRRESRKVLAAGTDN